MRHTSLGFSILIYCISFAPTNAQVSRDACLAQLPPENTVEGALLRVIISIEDAQLAGVQVQSITEHQEELVNALGEVIESDPIKGQLSNSTLEVLREDTKFIDDELKKQLVTMDGLNDRIDESFGALTDLSRRLGWDYAKCGVWPQRPAINRQPRVNSR